MPNPTTLADRVEAPFADTEWPMGRGPREWLVIEASTRNAVFASEKSKLPHGYIPRDAAEELLGRDLGATVWFTREESAAMRAHSEWRTTEP